MLIISSVTSGPSFRGGLQLPSAPRCLRLRWPQATHHFQLVLNACKKRPTRAKHLRSIRSTLGYIIAADRWRFKKQLLTARFLGGVHLRDSYCILSAVGSITSRKQRRKCSAAQHPATTTTSTYRLPLSTRSLRQRSRRDASAVSFSPRKRPYGSSSSSSSRTYRLTWHKLQ